jgi:hypothetical protein
VFDALLWQSAHLELLLYLLLEGEKILLQLEVRFLFKNWLTLLIHMAYLYLVHWLAPSCCRLACPVLDFFDVDALSARLRKSTLL